MSGDRDRLEHYARGVGGSGGVGIAGPDPLLHRLKEIDTRNIALRQALWDVYKMHGGISTADTPDGISDYDLIEMATNHSNQQGPAC